MNKDLTSSSIERQNVLNNQYALKKAEKHIQLEGVVFEGEQIFTKDQLVKLFQVSESTIEKYLSHYSKELSHNGYAILRGEKLRKFKELTFGAVIYYGAKTSVLGVFSFRAVLNLAMLLTESVQAKIIRNRLLDIVLDVLAEKAGGQTKYINQRDEKYLLAAYQEEGYRRQFTDALRDYVDGDNYKYPYFTNLIYESIFHENAAEYRRVLRLARKDKIRETMYSEVLTLIASYETGIAHELENYSIQLGRKISKEETTQLFKKFESHPLFNPLLLEARTKMASRDLCFRDALHQNLEAYVKAVPESDFNRFLGETAKSLEDRFKDPEILAVFKRLKDR